MLSKSLLLSFLVGATLLLSACGESEGEVAKNIKFKVSSGAFVLPTTLSTSLQQTCSENDVDGPRVRLRTSLVWGGTQAQGNLYPIILLFQIENPRLSGSFSASYGPSGDAETISSLFGLSTDFIVPDPNVIHTSSSCFLDIGGLPKPLEELAGRRELRTRAKVLLAGVARANDGTELPFTKETITEIVYTAGSVPID